MFIIVSRMALNVFTARGLVKKSARFSAVLINVGNLKPTTFHELAYVEMAAVDVLRLLMVLRVIGKVDRALVVAVELHGLLTSEA